jgi:hypothetical protein
MYYAKECAEKIMNSGCLVIYGARIVAKEVANCLMGNPYNKKIEAFMVSDRAGNSEEVLGRPVITIEESQEKYKNALIIVAVLEKYLDEIKETLSKYGFENVIYCGFESDLWSELRGNFFRELCLKKNGQYKTLEEEIQKYSIRKEQSVSVYSAKCHVDRELVDKRQYPWEKQIQVGAALTDLKVCDIRDDIGENISKKNRKYCELTALYWIWKNDNSDYKGLDHYRRHFELSEEIVEKLGGSDIDVVLTIPILNFPSVRQMYINDHRIDDWDTMLEILRKRHPDYYETAMELQFGIYYYAYNMLIARKEIFDEYCGWLFPILFECEKKCVPRDDKYQGRYIGFLAERLLSIFFIHNWNRWNIVHAKKNFLS